MSSLDFAFYQYYLSNASVQLRAEGMLLAATNTKA
jgi:hypothetical protein